MHARTRRRIAALPAALIVAGTLTTVATNWEQLNAPAASIVTEVPAGAPHQGGRS